MQALVLLGGAKELEGDAASADRTDHRGHFKRKFAFTERQLQIEDVISMDKGFTPDDTATHREIEYRSLTADLASGERKIEPHGNSKVFASIDWMRGMIQSKTGRQKSMTARWTTEWRHEDEGGEMFTWRLRVRPQWTLLLAPRTA